MFKPLNIINRFAKEIVNLDKEAVGYNIFIFRNFIQANSEIQDQIFLSLLLLTKPKKGYFKSQFPPLENEDVSKL